MPEVPPLESKRLFREWSDNAVRNPQARLARTAFCCALSEALTEKGEYLWTTGGMLRSKGWEGLACVTDMCADLARAAIAAYKDRNWYAGSALVRQLVETEYLMWSFSMRADEPSAWFGSSADAIRARFKPSEIRKASGGRLRDREYWIHCEWGGHPNPGARFLLTQYSSSADLHYLWADLGQHLERFWLFMCDALALQDSLATAGPIGLHDRVREDIRSWHDADPFAERIPLSLLP